MFVQQPERKEMARGTPFKCTECAKGIVAWSDDNHYYYDDDGHKKYAWHPNYKGLAKCVGVDTSEICMDCGNEFKSDVKDPAKCCPACSSSNFTSPSCVGGEPCPYCKEGVFELDTTRFIIS